MPLSRNHISRAEHLTTLTAEQTCGIAVFNAGRLTTFLYLKGAMLINKSILRYYLSVIFTILTIPIVSDNVNIFVFVTLSFYDEVLDDIVRNMFFFLSAFIETFLPMSIIVVSGVRSSESMSGCLCYDILPVNNGVTVRFNTYVVICLILIHTYMR